MTESNLSRRQWLIAGTGGLAAFGISVSEPAHTQTVRGTARILFGVPPGGPMDVGARLLADQMKSYATVTIVESRPGAGTRLALDAVKNSPPDGSVMILSPAGPLTLYPHIYKSLSYDPQRDFAPVTTLFTTPSVLAVGLMVPASVKSVSDFVSWCRGSPKQSSFGTPGTGTPMHFLGLTLSRVAGFEFAHIPYQGGAPAVQDLLGGQIASAIVPIANIVPHVSSGKVRALATTGSRRSPVLPDLPTVTEAGFPALSFAEWFGIFVPAKTPTEIVTELNRVLREALSVKSVLSRLSDFALEPAGSSPSEFATQIKSDTERWAAIVKGAGFTPLD
jgi:tripartite-type tricarboxylate transporter receptor subunit TctC